MEWSEEFEEEEPGHRHISHLFGLYPGKQITMQKNPELIEAARKTIDYRYLMAARSIFCLPSRMHGSTGIFMDSAPGVDL
jgi:hypothetical protein